PVPNLPALRRKAPAARRTTSVERKAPTWRPGPASRSRGARAASRERMRADAGHALARLDHLPARSVARRRRAEPFRCRGAGSRVDFAPGAATDRHSIDTAGPESGGGAIPDRIAG